MHHQVMLRRIVRLFFAADDSCKFGQLPVVSAWHRRQLNLLLALFVLAPNLVQHQLQLWRLKRSENYGALIAADDELASSGAVNLN